jgi:hypothetical protein
MEAPDLRSEQQSSATRTKNLCKNILLNSPHNVRLHKHKKQKNTHTQVNVKMEAYTNKKNKKKHTHKVNVQMEPRNCKGMEMKDAKHEVA